MIDYHLPRPGQGLDALNRLRQHWRADLAAVLVTGDDRAALSNALLDGRMACLVKPVSPQPLLAALQRQLGR
jgi:two-component system, sensor histidine kinase